MLITQTQYPTLPYPEEMLPIDAYDHYHVCVSGGVDSTVALVYMLYVYKVPREKITLVHMRIDGVKENNVFFDYPETAPFLEYLMRFFDLPLITIHDKKGLKQRIEERGMFPDSKARFCTSYGKRDVYSAFARTFSGNILMVSGERHEESSRRSKLTSYERHPATAEIKKGRRVDWFRPILHLTKSRAFEINNEHGVELHAGNLPILKLP